MESDGIRGSDQHCREVMEGLHNLQRKQVLCDVKVLCKNASELSAHKIVLISCCKYFVTNLSSSKENVVDLSKWSQESVSQILLFIYSGYLYLSSSSLSEIQQLAGLLQLSRALTLCEQFVRGQNDCKPGNISSPEGKERNVGQKPGIVSKKVQFCQPSSGDLGADSEKQPKEVVNCIDTNNLSRTNGSTIMSKDSDGGLPMEISSKVLSQQSSINQPEPLHNATDTTPRTIVKETATYSVGFPKSFEGFVDEILKEASKPVDDLKTQAISNTNNQGINEIRGKRRCSMPKRLEDFDVHVSKPIMDIEAPIHTETPAKRGRGRPRKVKVSPESESETKSENPSESLENENLKHQQPDQLGQNSDLAKVTEPHDVSGVNSIKDSRFRTCKKSRYQDVNSEVTASVGHSDVERLDANSVLSDGNKRKRGRPKGSRKVKPNADNNPAGECANIDEEGDIKDSESRFESNGDTCKLDSAERLAKKLTCQRCGEEFESLNKQEKHCKECNETADHNNPKKYQRKRCGACKLSFPDHQSYQVHRKIHIKERSRQVANKPHSCDLCKQTFRYENFLACHRFSKHNIPFDETKYSILKCSVKDCDYVTVNKWRYKVHLSQHNNDRTFTCDICGKGFKANSSLVTHKRSHSEQPRFECEQCGSKFTHLNSKEMHIKRIHKKEMSYLCHLCPHKCFVKTELLQHLHKDHGIPLPKGYVRYQCELCDFMTFRRFHFENHMNIHEGKRQYECEICHKKYATKVVLRCHMQFHKEPKHKCSWEGCKYAAVQKRRLLQHIRLMHTHQDEKPFPCHLCDYRAALNGNLKFHLRNVHHLDIPKKRTLGGKRETIPNDIDAKGDNSDEQSAVVGVHGSDIVSLAVASCGDISSLTSPNTDTETVVIFTTESSLPPQVTAAQVLQQITEGNTLEAQQSYENTNVINQDNMSACDSIVTLEANPVICSDVIQSNNPVHSHTNYQRGIINSSTMILPESTSIPSASMNACNEEGESTFPSVLGQSIVVNTQGLQMVHINNLSGQGMDSEQQDGGETRQENNQQSGLDMQEMLNSPYPSEGFLQDPRNINLMIQGMENRENYSTQTAYWTNF